MAADRPRDVIALELRCHALERDVSFLARGLLHAMTGQLHYSVDDFDHLRQLIVIENEDTPCSPAGDSSP